MRTAGHTSRLPALPTPRSNLLGVKVCEALGNDLGCVGHFRLCDDKRRCEADDVIVRGLGQQAEVAHLHAHVPRLPPPQRLHRQHFVLLLAFRTTYCQHFVRRIVCQHFMLLSPFRATYCLSVFLLLSAFCTTHGMLAYP